MVYSSYELMARLDKRASFYRKARVETATDSRGSTHTLWSYDTKVAEISRYCGDVSTIEVFGIFSPTTLRHIKEFLRQELGYIGTKKDIERDFIK